MIRQTAERKPTDGDRRPKISNPGAPRIRGARRRPHRGLTEIRQNSGLSAHALGGLINIDPKTIRAAEAGVIPQARVQVAIAEYFGLEAADLWPVRAGARR